MSASISTLKDNFNDNSLSALWTDESTGGGVVAETGGRLTFTPATDAENYPTVYSATTYDLTGAAFVLRLVSYLNAGTNREAVFLLFPSASNRLYWYISSSGNIQCRKTLSGVDSSEDYSTTYVAATHAWLRIRELDGDILWDSSTNGITWTNRALLAAPFAITAVTVAVWCGVYTAIADPGTMIVDNVGIPNSLGHRRMAALGVA